MKYHKLDLLFAPSLGRTGCFIAADIGIQCLKDKQTVDVLNTVANMRMDRGGENTVL